MQTFQPYFKTTKSESSFQHILWRSGHISVYNSIILTYFLEQDPLITYILLIALPKL